MTSINDITPLLAWLRPRIEAVYGSRLQHLVLFGSFARGTPHAESDVDLAVVLAGPVNPFDETARLAGLLAEAILKFGRVVSVFPVSTEEYAAGDRPILQSIRTEGRAT